MTRMSTIAALAAIAAAAMALGACASGTSPERGPAGVANPVMHPSTNEGQRHAKSQTGRGYQALVDRQTGKPRRQFTPCNLVTARQAAAVLGPIAQPVEAPQGPTCVYRSRDGSRFVTIAVQYVDFATIRHRLHPRTRVAVSHRTAYCGSYGQPGLYMPVRQGRVLSIGGPCAVARKLAVKALPRLPG